MATLTKELVHEMGQALRDFGYNIDDAHVQGYADKIIAREPVSGSPDLFIKNWLVKTGLLQGNS